MSAPAEALNKLRQDMREKSRVRIEHPDLPEALKTAAGELTATLWSSAQSLANDSLVTYLSSSKAQIAEAKFASAAINEEYDLTQKTLEIVQADLKTTHENISILNQELTTAVATKTSLEEQLHQIRVDNLAHQQFLADTRAEFTAELEKLRTATALTEDRLRGFEKRALLEIDRERNASIKLQKELYANGTAAMHSGERMRAEVTTLQEQLGDFRQRIGMLEGQLYTALAGRNLLTLDLKNAHSQLTEFSTQLSTARANAENWKLHAEEAKRTITEIRDKPNSGQSSRKIKPE